MAKNVAGGVVRGADLFGREGEIAELWRRLDRGSVLLTGPRRWGKSSVMAALEDQPQLGWDVIMLDVESIYTPSDLVIELTAEILQRQGVGERLRDATAGLPRALLGWVRGVVEEVEVGAEHVGTARIKLRDTIGAPDRWEILAPELVRALSALGPKVLVILDELPVMISNLLREDEPAALHFLRWFRSQRQRGPANVRFLVGGSINIEPTLERLGQQALLNDLERFHLDPFPRHRAAEFVVAVLAGERASAAEGVPAEIVERVETGVPFFLQVVLDECLTRMRADSRSMLILDDVAPALDAALGPNNKRRFSHYETRLRDHYGPSEAPARVVLHAISTSATGATEDAVEAALTTGGWGAADLDKILVALEGDYYVVRDGGRVRFAHGFLRRWWLRNAPAGGRR